METVETGKSGSKSKIATKRAIEWLRKGALRPTQQRIALAKILVGDGKDCHITPEFLYDAARKRGRISLATVYNTLHAFCDAGLMKEISVDGHKVYFDTRVDEHPHFFWEDESKLADAPVDELGFSKLPAPPEGTKITKVDVVIHLAKI